MENKNALWVILGCFFILVIVIGVLVFRPGSIGAITNNPDAITNDCEEVQVPYEEQEEYLKTEYYTETVPYTQNVPLTYTYKTGSSWGCGDLGNYKKCFEIDVTNLDSTAGGIFKINCNFRTIKRTLSDSHSDYIKQGDTYTFTCVADTNLGEDVELTYNIIPPTKPEVKYKEVQRERQVTAYRPVTKYRTEQRCD